MMKSGRRFRCKVEAFVITRNGSYITISKGETVRKVKNTFSDLLKLRDMYVIEESGIEVDIPIYVIKNKFKETIQ